MMDAVERRGEVIGFAQGVAQIRLERMASACNGCGSRGSCSSGGAAAQVIEMRLPERTRLGDHVNVSMPSSSVALAAVLGYLLPPVGLLTGAVVASMHFEGDATAVLGAGFGFVAGVLLARLIARFAFGQGAVPSTCHPDFQPGEHP